MKQNLSKFFEDFRNIVRNYRSSFNLKHGLMFGAGVATTLIALTAGVLFGIGAFGVGSAIMPEVICFSLGGVTGAVSTLVGMNGLRASKKLKELSTANEFNMVKLINKYSKDENKNVRDFAEVLSNAYVANEQAEKYNINPFEDVVDQPEVPFEAFKKPVDDAIENATKSPIDYDI